MKDRKARGEPVNVPYYMKRYLDFWTPDRVSDWYGGAQTFQELGYDTSADETSFKVEEF